MPQYNIEIRRLIRENADDGIALEIWADILDRATQNKMTKRIWWEDTSGVFHDETSQLPVELRGLVDNALIHKSKKW